MMSRPLPFPADATNHKQAMGTLQPICKIHESEKVYMLPAYGIRLPLSKGEVRPVGTLTPRFCAGSAAHSEARNVVESLK